MLRFVSAPVLSSVLLGLALRPAGAGEPLSAPAPPKLPTIDYAKLNDPKEVARIADELERTHPAAGRPEAVRMLVTILRGNPMDGAGGWFGPAETRYTWGWLAERHGVDPKKGAVPAAKFRGPASAFKIIDRDGDGRIVADDFDWSDRNPFVIQMNFATRVFRRMNPRGDGKLTPADMGAFFKRVADGKDHITPDDLRAALLASGPGGFLPGDAPTLEMLVRGLYAGELGSIHEGPQLGAAAPDFTLKTLDGKEAVTLSKLIGPKPVVLVFGNFTCGPFRALTADVDAIYQRHKADATFAMVYVREAHPSDGWTMASNTKVGVEVKQPTTYDERVKVCSLFTAKLKPAVPVLVDEIDDRAGNLYSGMPDRLYVIDTAGKVAYKSGRGPFGFKAAELEQALAMALAEPALAK